ncbi:MAG: hypothetical protein V3T49_04585 [Dehalococcoidia bacterium]
METIKMFSGSKNKWLVLVAIAALAAFVIACGTDETKLDSDNGNGGVGAQPTAGADGSEGNSPPSPVGDLGYEVVEALAPIESVQILTLESYPEQFVVQVTSGLPSGCATFDRADVTQDGTVINIDVYNMVPAPGELIACTAIYGIHDENVGLGSDFERGTEFTVIVNGVPSGSFTTGSAPLQVDPGFVIEPAPVEALDVYVGDDSGGATPYHVNVLVGLSNGCKELIEPNVVRSGATVFDIYPVVKVPTGLVACTDDYRLEGVVVNLGVVGEGLIACTVYTVKAGEETFEFQAIAPNVRCADPGDATPTPAPPTGGTSIISDALALELSLKGLGADVENGGQSAFSAYFGVSPSELKVNGVAVQIYEFAPGTAAVEASMTVSADGATFETADGIAMSVFWIAPPHWYLFGNAIILYVGDDADIADLLGAVATQFAGSDFEPTTDLEADDSEFTTRLATIEKVGIASTRSIPPQHLVGVTIMLSNGCEEFNSIDWTAEGREVHIVIQTQVPSAPMMCTLAIAYEDHSINIGSEFEAGVEYDVFVNGDRQGTFLGG